MIKIFQGTTAISQNVHKLNRYPAFFNQDPVKGFILPFRCKGRARYFFFSLNPWQTAYCVQDSTRNKPLPRRTLNREKRRDVITTASFDRRIFYLVFLRNTVILNTEVSSPDMIAG